jgi:hypothetical protein
MISCHKKARKDTKIEELPPWIEIAQFNAKRLIHTVESRRHFTKQNSRAFSCLFVAKQTISET